MANRYWVGGTATWDNTVGTKWAATSGGAGGASVPTTADDVFFDAASTGTCTIISTNTGAKSINCTGFTGTITGNGAITISGSVTLSAGMTFSHTGVKTFNSTGTITSAGKTFGATTVDGVGHTVTLNDNLSIGTSATFTLTNGTFSLGAGFILSCGIFSSNNSNTRDIMFGAGYIQLNTSLSPVTALDIANATNFTWSGTGLFTHNLTISTTVVFGTTGGTTSNAPNLSATGTSTLRTLTITTGSYFKNLDFSSNAATISGTYNACGNITLGINGSYLNLRPTFVAPATVICNGSTLGNTTVNGNGIIVSFGDDFFGRNLTLTQGTLNAAFYNVNVTILTFSSSNSNTRTLYMGDQTWNITFSGTVWDTTNTTGLTLFPYTSTINLSNNSSPKTFAGGGLTYYNINQGGGVFSALTITGSNTFNNITNSIQPSTVTFAAGTTQTVSNFGLSGTTGNLITINSNTPGSQATLSKSSGTVTVSNVSIRDSNATGGAVWDATSATNTNLGNNSGWVFPSNGAFMQFF